MTDVYTVEKFPYDMVHASFAQYSCDWIYCSSKRKQLNTRIIIVSGRKTHKFGFYELIPTSVSNRQLQSQKGKKSELVLQSTDDDTNAKSINSTNHITFEAKSFIKDYKKHEATLNARNFANGYAHSFITKDNKYLIIYKHGFSSDYNVYDLRIDSWLLGSNCKVIHPHRWINPTRTPVYSWNDSIRMAMINDELLVLSCNNYFQIYSIGDEITRPVFIKQCFIDYDGFKFDYHGICCLNFKYQNLNDDMHMMTDMYNRKTADLEFEQNNVSSMDTHDHDSNNIKCCKSRITQFKLIIFGGSRIKQFSKSFIEYDIDVLIAPTLTQEKSFISDQGRRHMSFGNERKILNININEIKDRFADVQYFKHFGHECIANSKNEPVLLLLGGDCDNLSQYNPIQSILLVNLKTNQIKKITNVCVCVTIINIVYVVVQKIIN